MNIRKTIFTSSWVCRTGWILAAIILLSGCRKADPTPTDISVLTNGVLCVWSSYNGKIESRRVHTILSRLGGQSTLVEIVPEGSRVQKDGVIARLDPTRIEREIVKLESALATAKSEYESLKNAKWPLKLSDLGRQLTEAKAKEDEEQQFLIDSRELLKDDLVSVQEIQQQEGKVTQAQAKSRQLEEEIKLSKDYLQPLDLEQAHAKLTATERELMLARQELLACTITAPADGIIGYLPAYFGSEFRVARVGDTIFMNMPFMIIPDMRDWVVHCYIPESELGRIAQNAPAHIIPVAFPDLILTGRVESVGATAQVVSEKPAWQKYFHVVITLLATDERMRSGMSATVQILAYENPQALLVPRVAVQWQGTNATVRRLTTDGAETCSVALGWADDRNFEVCSGLHVGDRILVKE